MSAYFVANITIKNLSEYQKYLEGFDEIFEKYEGKVLAADDHPEVLEGTFEKSRCVIIEFPTMAGLKRWYDSDAYQTLAQIRKNSSTSDIVAVNGE